MTDQTPKEAGWYFARHKTIRHVEVVRVFADDVGFEVTRSGVHGYSKPDAFTWGPRITLPDELEKLPNHGRKAAFDAAPLYGDQP